jgi:hypothetical protein
VLIVIALVGRNYAAVPGCDRHGAFYSLHFLAIAAGLAAIFAILKLSFGV